MRAYIVGKEVCVLGGVGYPRLDLSLSRETERWMMISLFCSGFRSSLVTLQYFIVSFLKSIAHPHRLCTMPPAFVSTRAAKRRFWDQLIVELPRDHPLTDSRPLRDSLGHTPVQVAVGALLGMVVGYAHFNMWLISQGVDL